MVYWLPQWGKGQLPEFSSNSLSDIQKDKAQWLQPKMPSYNIWGIAGMDKATIWSDIVWWYDKTIATPQNMEVARKSVAAEKQIQTQATQEQQRPTIAPLVNNTLQQLQVDVQAWMPSNKMFDLYKDIPEELQQELYSDLRAGMPIDADTISKYYPELTLWYMSSHDLINANWTEYINKMQWGGTVAQASRDFSSAIDMQEWEWLNPLWQTANEASKFLQKIPTMTQKDWDRFSKKNLAWFWEWMWAVPTMIVNAIPSFLKTVVGMWAAILNPLDTVAWIFSLVATPEWHQALYDRYGSRENLGRTMTEDPVWLASDVASVAAWWAWIAKVWATAGRLWATAAWMSKTAAWLWKFAAWAWEFAKLAWEASTLWVNASLEWGMAKLWGLTKFAEWDTMFMKSVKGLWEYTMAASSPKRAVNLIKRSMDWSKEKLADGIWVNKQILDASRKNAFVPHYLNELKKLTSWPLWDVTKESVDTLIRWLEDEVKIVTEANDQFLKDGGMIYDTREKVPQKFNMKWFVEAVDKLFEKYTTIEYKFVKDAEWNLVKTNQIAHTAEFNAKYVNEARKIVDSVSKAAAEWKLDRWVAIRSRQRLSQLVPRDETIPNSEADKLIKAIRREYSKRLRDQASDLAALDDKRSAAKTNNVEIRKQLIRKDDSVNFNNLKKSNSLAFTELNKRLDKYFPWLTDRVEAIDLAYQAAKQTKWLWRWDRFSTKAIMVTLWSALGWMWGWVWRYLAWAVLWMFFESKIEWTLSDFISKRNETNLFKQLPEEISKMSDEAQYMLEDINTRLEENKEMSVVDRKILDWVSEMIADRIKKAEEVAKQENLKQMEDDAKYQQSQIKAENDRKMKEYQSKWETKGMGLPLKDLVDSYNTVILPDKNPIVSAPWWEVLKSDKQITPAKNLKPTEWTAKEENILGWIGKEIEDIIKEVTDEEVKAQEAMDITEANDIYNEQGYEELKNSGKLNKMANTNNNRLKLDKMYQKKAVDMEARRALIGKVWKNNVWPEYIDKQKRSQEADKERLIKRIWEDYWLDATEAVNKYDDLINSKTIEKFIKPMTKSELPKTVEPTVKPTQEWIFDHTDKKKMEGNEASLFDAKLKEANKPWTTMRDMDMANMEKYWVNRPKLKDYEARLERLLKKYEKWDYTQADYQEIYDLQAKIDWINDQAKIDRWDLPF